MKDRSFSLDVIPSREAARREMCQSDLLSLQKVLACDHSFSSSYHDYWAGQFAMIFRYLGPSASGEEQTRTDRNAPKFSNLVALLELLADATGWNFKLTACPEAGHAFVTAYKRLDRFCTSSGPRLK